jgi:hypothetical protein
VEMLIEGGEIEIIRGTWIELEIFGGRYALSSWHNFFLAESEINM